MCGAKCIVHVAISIRSQLLGEFLLAFLYSFLGCGFLLVRSVVGQATGLAFFFGIETEVLKQQGLARLQSSGLGGSFFAHAVAGKLYFNAEQLVQVLQDVFQGVFLRNTFRTAQVRTNNDTTTVGQNFLQRRKCGTHTRIIGDVEVFVQGHIEVHADERLFTGKVKLIDCHNTYLFKSVVFILLRLILFVITPAKLALFSFRSS